MLDFTEQEASTTLQPKSSPDTPIVSDNLPDIKESEQLADPVFTANTEAALAPYRDEAEYFQDEEETVEV